VAGRRFARAGALCAYIEVRRVQKAVDRTELGNLLLSVSYLEGDFVLRSGKRSRYYLDKYLFETDPRVLGGVVREMASLIRHRMGERGEYARLAAPELGAVSIGAGLSLELGMPFVIVRKQTKEYGTGKAIEGAWHPGERFAVVEDIVTSGGAALSAVEQLRALGLVVEDLYCVVDREEGGRENARKMGLELIPLFTAGGLGIKKG
jgi:orotate phosphoribosyltransferase